MNVLQWALQQAGYVPISHSFFHGLAAVAARVVLAWVILGHMMSHQKAQLRSGHKIPQPVPCLI